MKKLFLVLSLIGVLGFYGCSSDSDTIDNNPKKTTNLELSSQTSKAFPVLGITFSVQADWVGVVSPGCYTVNIRIYMTNDSNGQVSLIHSGNVNVGECGRIANNGCLGEYKGDYIVKDNYESGMCLRELFDDNPEIYKMYLVERAKIIANN